MRIKKTPFRALFRRLVDDIQEKISSGSYANEQLLPSERELCLRYNCSRQTVRNALKVLSNQGWVNSLPGKGTAVQYPPLTQRNARPQPSPSAKQIGVICPARNYLNDTAMMRVLMGLKSVLSQEGYSISLSVSQKDETCKIVPVYQEWLRNNSMAGYICATVPAALQRNLLEHGVPVLSMGYNWDEISIPSCALDCRVIYARAVGYLHTKGHERICALVLNEDTVYTREVLGGYDQGRLALDKSSAEVSVERYQDTAYDIVAALRRTLKSKPRCTAIILHGVDHIDNVMQFFAHEGLRVPEDVFVLTATGLPQFCKCIDQLAYFDYDTMQIARRSAEKLLEIIHTGKSDPLHELYLSGDFVGPHPAPVADAAPIPVVSQPSQVNRKSRQERRLDTLGV